MSTLPLQFDDQDKLEARLRAVLDKGEGTYPLPDDCRKLLRILRFKRGAHTAIRGHELAQRLKTNDREIKALVKQLTEDFGIPVGISRAETPGYFLIESAEELQKTLAIYASQAKSMFRRCRALGGTEYAEELLGQLRMDDQEKSV